MSVPNPRIKLTYRDYANTPDDERYELLDGELIGGWDDRARRRFTSGLRRCWDGRWRSSSPRRASDGSTSLPSTSCCRIRTSWNPTCCSSPTRRAHVVTAANVQGAPDLVVEILSPSSVERDRTLKRALYARHGVREYWIVDTEARTVAVLLLRNGGFETAGTYGEGETLTSPTLPGFALEVADLFR